MIEMTNQRLAGKVVLVMGGSRGIGAAIVERLSEEGASVIFTYRVSETKAARLACSAQEQGRKVFAIQADSADTRAVTGAIHHTVAELGRLDVFINNAAIAMQGKILDVAIEDFDKLVAVNLRAAFVGIQAAARHMTSGGRIVTIGSVSAERTALRGFSVYSMTKAALAALVRGVANELASSGITVNNVQPGPTATEMSPEDGKHGDLLRSFIPARRFGRVEEVASLVAYLVGPEAAFITGTSMSIDGGFLT